MKHESHIIVCIKSVMLSSPAKGSSRNYENCVLNPFDRPAIEAALALKKTIGGRVTAISMGPTETSATLREALALGVDESILISDPALKESDTLATSTVLSAAVNKLAPYQNLFFGMKTVDSDTGHIGPQVSAKLSIPFIGGVINFKLHEERLEIDRIYDKVHDKYLVGFPSALSVHPRYHANKEIDLKALEKAYSSQELRTWGLSDLGLMPEQVGLSASPTRVVSIKPNRKKHKCQFIEGEKQVQVGHLMEQLTKLGVLG